MLNKYKRIVLGLFLLSSHPIFASDLSLLTSSGNIIHTTHVESNIDFIVPIKLKITLGQGNIEACQPEKVFMAGTMYVLYNQHDVKVNGDLLVQLSGVNYTCVIESYQYQENAPIIISYNLYNDGKKYISADPAKHSMSFNSK